MFNAGCKFDTMPVMRSPQGWNKSTAIRVLFGDRWYSDADLGDLRNKDAALKSVAYGGESLPKLTRSIWQIRGR